MLTCGDRRWKSRFGPRTESRLTRAKRLGFKIYYPLECFFSHLVKISVPFFLLSRSHEYSQARNYLIGHTVDANFDWISPLRVASRTGVE